MTCIFMHYIRKRKRKRDRDVRSNSQNYGECEMESLVFKGSDQKGNTSSQAFVLFFPDLADVRQHPVQDKLVVYTMMRDEPPQLSLLLPLQG